MIYICIPAHNEEQTVGVVLWKIRQVMAEYPRDYQLLVVDDASTDRTPEVLAPYARVLPLTVVRTEARQGEGAALEMMLREAVRRSEYPKRDVAITLQADFTQEPDELVVLIKRMEAGADIVVGQTQPGKDVSLWVRWARALALRVLGRSRIPAGVTDPFTGYRAYRVSTVKGALADRTGRLVHWSGWAGAAELLLATAPHARRIDTVDLVERRERLQRPSRLRPFRALRDVWSLAREARPLQVASPAELDRAMSTVAAVRTSEVATRRGGRTERTERTERGERTQRGERGRGSNEDRRTREQGRGQRQGAGPARESGGERQPRGEKARTGAEARRGGAGKGDGKSGKRSPEQQKPGSAEAQRPARAEAQRTPPAEAQQTPLAEAQRPPAAEPEVTGTPLPAVPEAVASPNGNQVPAAGAPERTRRKRPRRRKRGGGGGGERAGAEAPAANDESAVDRGREQPQNGADGQPESPELAAVVAALTGDAPADFAAATDAGSEGEAPAGNGEAPAGNGEQGDAAAQARSRRRRRGRRGGRRRAASGNALAADTPAEGGDAAATRPTPEELAQQIEILELIDGDRRDDS